MKLFIWLLGAVALWYLWHKFDDAAYGYVDSKVQPLLPKPLS